MHVTLNDWPIILYFTIGLGVAWLHMKLGDMFRAPGDMLLPVIGLLALMWPLIALSMIINHYFGTPQGIKTKRPPSNEKDPVGQAAGVVDSIEQLSSLDSNAGESISNLF